MCRESCRYFPFCGGGPPGNKYFENGTFASTETLFCRLHMKACLDVTADWLERHPPAACERAARSEPRHEPCSPAAGSPSRRGSTSTPTGPRGSRSGPGWRRPDGRVLPPRPVAAADRRTNSPCSSPAPPHRRPACCRCSARTDPRPRTARRPARRDLPVPDSRSTCGTRGGTCSTRRPSRAGRCGGSTGSPRGWPSSWPSSGWPSRAGADGGGRHRGRASGRSGATRPPGGRRVWGRRSRRGPRGRGRRCRRPRLWGVVNLGDEDTGVVLVNLPLADAGGGTRPAVPGRPAPATVGELVARFLRAFPDYPPVRLRLGPGEGCRLPAGRADPRRRPDRARTDPTCCCSSPTDGEAAGAK